jgi:hypothetical protein
MSIEESGVWWTAVSSAAGVIGLFVVLVRHMLTNARQQGARDERERQMAGRIDKLEDRVEALAVIEQRLVAIDTTVKGWDKRFEALERSVRDGFDSIDQSLRGLAPTAVRARSRRVAKTLEEA